jgi:hypothetical protein
MADTRRNLHQLLKGKQLNSALYGVNTEVLHDLTAVLKESAATGETANTIEDFCEKRRRKRKPTNDADKKPRNQAYSIHHGSQRPPTAIEA